MLKAIRVTKDNKDLKAIKALYESAFPENEKTDFDFILEKSETDGVFDIMAVYDGELFVGFVITLDSGDISSIGYFAVDGSLRSMGYGSGILKTVHDSKPHQRFMADVENPDVECINREQREKRLRFYFRNGYKKTGIEYKWNEEDYILLSYNGDISMEEVEAFWNSRREILKEAERAMKR